MCQDLNQSALIPVQQMYDVNEMLKVYIFFFQKVKQYYNKYLQKWRKVITEIYSLVQLKFSFLSYLVHLASLLIPFEQIYNNKTFLEKTHFKDGMVQCNIKMEIKTRSL